MSEVDGNLLIYDLLIPRLGYISAIGASMCLSVVCARVIVVGLRMHSGVHISL